jgi:multiple antibiotic resistance protein
MMNSADMLSILVSALVTLLVVIDPPGLGPIFIGLTDGLERRERRLIAWEACLIAFGVLAGSALVGNWLLARLGISLGAFRIAGGLLLFAIAFEMVFERRIQRKASQAGSPPPSRGIAAFPLGIPLMAGPGAITAMLLLAGRMDGNLVGLGLLIAVMALVLLAVLIVFLLAERLEWLLGVQGQLVLGRLLGVLLAALAVQYVADGVLSFVKA